MVLKKDLEQVELDDLQRLIAERCFERKSLEFKRDFYRLDANDPKFREKQKIELLKDLSSFANCRGGDLIIGIAEEDGVATAIRGFKPINGIDNLMLQIQELARAWIEPRIPLSLRPVRVGDNLFALVARIERSRIGPHRVIYGNSGHFFSRNSNGVFAMDTSDLRRVFTSTASQAESLERFRVSRIATIANDETPVPLKGGARLVCHLIPMDALESMIDLSAQEIRRQDLPLIQPENGLATLVRKDGIVVVGDRNPEPRYGYVYMTWNGIIEAVETQITASSDPNASPQFKDGYVQVIARSVEKYMRVYAELGIETPIFCCISLLGTHGMLICHNHLISFGMPVDVDQIQLPPVEVFDADSSRIQAALQPAFDRLWNAAGHSHCPLIRDDGASAST